MDDVLNFLKKLATTNKQNVDEYLAGKEQGIPDALNPVQPELGITDENIETRARQNRANSGKNSLAGNLLLSPKPDQQQLMSAKQQLVNEAIKNLSAPTGMNILGGMDKPELMKGSPIVPSMPAVIPEKVKPVPVKKSKQEKGDGSGGEAELKSAYGRDGDIQPFSEDMLKKEEEEPTLSDKEIDELTKPSGPPSEIKKAEYTLDQLQLKQQEARNKAQILVAQMAAVSSAANIAGKQADLTPYKLAYENELGRASDYEALIKEQRIQKSQNVINEQNELITKIKDMDFQNQKKMQDKDSPETQAMRAWAKSSLLAIGQSPDSPMIKNIDVASGAMISELLPKTLQTVENLQARISVAEMQAEAKKEAAAQAALMRKDALAAKEEDKNNRRFDQMNKMLQADIASGRSVFGRNAQIVRGANALEALVSGKKLDEVNPQQFYELAKGLDAMLSPGAPTVSGVEKLMPKTALKSIADIKQYFTGTPEGMQMQKFVKSYLDTIKREKLIASKAIVSAQNKMLSSYKNLKEKDPERWEQVLRDNELPTEDEIKEQQKETKLSVKEPSKMVKMQAPDGSIRLIPEDKVDAAIKAGGKLVK